MTPIYTRKTSEPRGFTLIELLVTLVIMSVLAGMATLALGGQAQRQARDEADRLYRMLGFASEEATLAGEEYGLQVSEESYAFVRFDAEKEEWVPSEMPAFVEHELPAAVRMRVVVEDLPALPGARRDGEAGVPEVLILSSGEISSFHVDFVAGDSPDPAAAIGSDGSGTLVHE